MNQNELTCLRKYLDFQRAKYDVKSDVIILKSVLWDKTFKLSSHPNFSDTNLNFKMEVVDNNELFNERLQYQNLTFKDLPIIFIKGTEKDT